MLNRTIVFCLVVVFAGSMLSPYCVGQDQGTETKDVPKPVQQNQQAKTQAYLGIGVMPLHPALASQLAETIGDGRGVMIESLVKDSPAEKAGLQIHDVLVAFDDQDVYSTEQLVKLIRDSAPSEEVSIALVRKGEKQEIKLKLGELTLPQQLPRLSARRVPFENRFPRPELFSRELLRNNMADVENWSQFESLNISKNKDGKYEAKITFKDDEKTLERTFAGTREELVKAIEEDKELPESARDHLLRGLDFKVRVRELFNFDELFNQSDFPQEFFRRPMRDF